MASKADNDEALKALALRMGASVRLSNGETFNASGSRESRKRAEVVDIRPPATDELLHKIVEMLAKQQAPTVVVPEMPPPQVVVEAPQVTVQPAPVPKVVPVSWKFTFERNESGTIRSITATPTP
jgi:hypothetical protein